MRIGEVIGRLTLSPVDPKLVGGRFLVIRPHDPASLRENRMGGGDIVVAYDELGAQVGDRVGFSEGREAAMPFHPTPVAVDAYVACLIDSVTYGV
ncbi:MAG TPA: EutN/CcmL family microcompartment protein [Phycisphaerae bacterium]|nr:EutN/CcmL family microcompartment protein [Phycisphaerae bacterium]HOB73910.1 EutN/CcmL family microcompartment protein [Phycisphaerae bacterium]HOJ56292.1 EutN/CcmL family microcompartment protein [Phycisphaerae bacterium]HOL28116.1 EutN/CcmL family microcompartment protein [Phycisphaerae bacterium]HPP19773.1 EutN/CcmL family microcompartment protein [Phycisphaerae bacterium]